MPKKIDQKYLNGTITLEEGEIINLLKLENVLADYEQPKVTGTLKKELEKKNVELSDEELTELDLIDDTSRSGTTAS